MLRPTANMSQAWLCLGTAAQFQSKALKLNKFLELSAITVNEKKTVKQTQRERERERERERCMCHFTYRIESVAINFLVANLGALDGVVEFSTEPSYNSSNLGISMEDYIKH